MRIAHALGWYYPDSLGGTEVYVAGLCRRLRRAGHDVFIAAPEAGRRGTNEYRHDQTPVFRYPVPAVPTRDEAQGLVTARGAELFHRWLSQLRPDVLHVHSLVTGLGLAELRVAKRLGVSIVLTHHLPSLGYVCRLGSLMERSARACDGIASPRRCSACVLISRGMPAGAAAAMALLPRAVSAGLGTIPGAFGTAMGMTASIAHDRVKQEELAGLVDFQVALNESGRRIILYAGVPADRVVMNRLGTDHSAVVRKPSPLESPTSRPVRVGFLGRVDHTKGVREILLAVRKLPRETPLTIEIVGPVASATNPDFAQELQQLAIGDARITFSPPVPSADVPRILAGFDVLCCPSTWFENGPTVALEAMAVGTPLIASRIGNLAEIVEDDVNGRLVPPGDVDALAAALAQVAGDPAGTIDRWRARLGSIRSLDEVAEEYLALYARLDRRQARAS